MQKMRDDQEEKMRVEQVCKAHRGTFVNYPDKSYKCGGVLDATIDFDMGKVSLINTGSKSRLKEE